MGLDGLYYSVELGPNESGKKDAFALVGLGNNNYYYLFVHCGFTQLPNLILSRNLQVKRPIDKLLGG